MLLYMNNAVDTSMDNMLNWWEDAGFTIPHGAVPLSTDTANLDSATVASGTCAAPVVSAAGTSIDGGTFNLAFTGTPTEISAGTFTGAASIGGCAVTGGTFSGGVTTTSGASFTLGILGVNTITASGTTFVSGMFSGGITDGGGCTYTAGTYTGTISVSGSSTINGGDFTGAMLTLGIGTGITAGSFPTITVQDSNVSGGTFGIVHLKGTVNFTTAIGGNVTDAGITNIIAYSGGQTITLNIPAANNVLNAAGGNYYPPAVNKVQQGFAFGVGNTGSTGTLPAGGSIIGG